MFSIPGSDELAHPRLARHPSGWVSKRVAVAETRTSPDWRGATTKLIILGPAAAAMLMSSGCEENPNATPFRKSPVPNDRVGTAL
ncbi:hypothetical protein VTJ04DRAFT_5141 [Mycothermus thermophilus]|uniref:uncharacterized protein n=1 Tax=Humicola insolens TaxID=85995 RepID=UPI0037428C51